MAKTRTGTCFNATIVSITGTPTTTQIWASDKSAAVAWLEEKVERDYFIAGYIYDVAAEKLTRYEIHGVRVMEVL